MVLVNHVRLFHFYNVLCCSCIWCFNIHCTCFSLMIFHKSESILHIDAASVIVGVILVVTILVLQPPFIQFYIIIPV